MAGRCGRLEESLSRECWWECNTKYTSQSGKDSLQRGYLSQAPHEVRDWATSEGNHSKQGEQQVQRHRDKNRAVWVTNRKAVGVTEALS